MERRAFVYDGWNLVLETIATIESGTTSITERQYFWGLDLSDTLQGAGGVGGLIAVSVGAQFYFPAYDANGNITRYCDASGNVVASYTYDAFGNTVAQSGAMADTFPHRFSTKYFDTETSLYYYGFRYYSPELMRWLNRDPIEEQGGANLYAFCGNDGLNQIDEVGCVTVKYNAWAKNPWYKKDRFANIEIMGEGDIDQIHIEEVAMPPDDFGGFDPVPNVTECEVSVHLSIRISYNLANAPRKTTYTYHPHTVFGGKLRDAYTSTVDGSLPLKGEVIAHERGHAKAFVLHTKPKFDSYVAKYSCPLSQSEQKEIKRLFAKARKETLTENAEMANDASRNWFKCNGFAENAYEGIHGTQFYDYSK